MKRRILFVAACALACVSCGRSRDRADDEEARAREREMQRFVEAIRVVQDRYVDVEKVQLDGMISNSLKGMITSIDPNAEVFYTGTTEQVSVPDDAPLLEWSGPDESGIAVLHIFGFASDMKRQLRKLEGEVGRRGVAGILIDARGAYGEDFEAAALVAEWFLPRETAIGSLVQRQGERVETYIARRAPAWVTNQVVVLTDPALVGPGEILAAALRANERCILVGRPTRGVAVVRSPVKITDEWTVLLSTAQAREPGGRNITGNPIHPDIAAQAEPDNRENIDWVHRAGLAALRERITPLAP